MSISKCRLADLADRWGEAKPVPVPIDTPVSRVRSCAITPEGQDAVRFGLWECSEGRWVRQVEEAEFCHFLEGEAVFHPADGGEPVHLSAGDVAWFPARSRGEWTVLSASRKIFLLDASKIGA